MVSVDGGSPKPSVFTVFRTLCRVCIIHKSMNSGQREKTRLSVGIIGPSNTPGQAYRNVKFMHGVLGFHCRNKTGERVSYNFTNFMI